MINFHVWQCHLINQWIRFCFVPGFLRMVTWWQWRCVTRVERCWGIVESSVSSSQSWVSTRPELVTVAAGEESQLWFVDVLSILSSDWLMCWSLFWAFWLVQLYLLNDTNLSLIGWYDANLSLLGQVGCVWRQQLYWRSSPHQALLLVDGRHAGVHQRWSPASDHQRQRCWWPQTCWSPPCTTPGNTVLWLVDEIWYCALIGRSKYNTLQWLAN